MSKSTKICRYCGEIILSDAQFCGFCGKYLYKKPDGTTTQQLVCSKCEAIVNTDDNFCQYCGAVFHIPEEEDEDNNVDIIHNKNGIHYHIGILLTSLAIAISSVFLLSVGNNSGFLHLLGLSGLIFIASEIFLYIYFVPSIIAIENNHSNVYLIYICNLLLGITVIGWFVVLVMAMNNNPQK